MDAAHQLMFALQSPVGLRFGATLQVETDRITFEMDLKIPKGTECSFRMELSGEDDTIMGTVRIERALPARGGSLPRYICRILEMPADDRIRFDGWRRDLATGGVSRRLERDPEQLRAQISTKMVGGATEAEARAVLERMNAKSSSRRKDEGYVEGDPLGLATEKADTGTVDKAQLREKLREETPVDVDDSLGSAKEEAVAIERAKAAMVEELAVEEVDSPSWMPGQADRASPDPEPPAVTKDPPSPAVIQSPSTPPSPVTPPAVGPSPAPPTVQVSSHSDASPPLIVVDAEANPIAVTMIYLSRESFVRDYDAVLHTSAVTIDHPSLTQLYHYVNITVQLADGESINAMGQMVAQLPTGMAIALEFDAVQRASLAQAAGR